MTPNQCLGSHLAVSQTQTNTAATRVGHFTIIETADIFIRHIGFKNISQVHEEITILIL